MFKALLIKEWREKASIAAFGLGLMAAFLAAFLALGDKRDISDLVTAGFLLLVFPFLGLLLGSSAFETEFRDHAWAYLLSRPIRKETAWLAKFVALATFLAGLWVVFLVMIKALPALADVATGYKLPAGLQVDVSFFPLAVLSSFYYFAVAFSLSILFERQFSLVFASLFTGLVLQALAHFLAFRLAGEQALSSADRPALLKAYWMALLLSGLAFLGASLLTFRKTDFSQPRKKCAVFAKLATGFLALAWLLAAAWLIVGGTPKAAYLSGIEAVADNQIYFSTGRGLYRYDAATDGLERLSRQRHAHVASVRAGKVAYLEMETNALWGMNTDGSEKRLLFRPEVDRNSPKEPLRPVSALLSPDGRTVVFCAVNPMAGWGGQGKFSLWSAGSDGSGLKGLPLEPAVAGRGRTPPWLFILAWRESGTKIVFRQGPGDYGTGNKLWLYDLASGSAHVLLENARLGYPLPSPRQDYVAIPYSSEPGAVHGLFILDLKTMETTDVPGKLDNTALHISWTPGGDRLAILYGTAAGGASLAVYSLTESRITASRDLEAETRGESGLWVDWIREDGQVLLSDSKAGVLRILDKDLADQKKFTVPSSVGSAFWPATTGRVILLTDTQHNRLWRLDLKTEKWKKIW